MKWLKEFKRGLFTKSQIIVGITLTMLTTSALVFAYQQLMTLNIFTAGTPISSAAVNANFQKINEALMASSNGFKVALGTNQVITSNVWTVYENLDFNIDYDFTSHQYATSVKNTGSFTVQEAGFYHITLMAGRSLNTQGNWKLVARKAGNLSGVNSWAHSIYLSSFSAIPSVFEKREYLNSGTVIKLQGKYDCCTPGGTATLDASKVKVIFKKL